jgi:hypothetical protein
MGKNLHLLGPDYPEVQEHHPICLVFSEIDSLGSVVTTFEQTAWPPAPIPRRIEFFL